MKVAVPSNPRPTGDAAGRGSRRDDDIIETAWLYFHDGLTQGEIAMSGLLDQFTLSDMRAKGASGVICARIIDQDGKPMPAPKERQMIGVSLDQMRDKDMGMLVSAGLDGLPAARAAMKGGYVTHLGTALRLRNSFCRICKLRLRDRTHP